MKVKDDFQHGNNINKNTRTSPTNHNGTEKEDGEGAGYAFEVSSQTSTVPRNKSTGNLLRRGRETASRDPMRRSVAAGTTQEVSLTKTPSFDHDHSLGISGLRRIRGQPPSRGPTVSSSPDSQFIAPQLLSTVTIPLSAATSRSASLQTTPAPSSPGLEDLQRFPTESLHSFSFAHQSEDALHSRQNILKKSIQFMQDRLGGPASNLALASAQARVSGDTELQSMLELLKKANLLGIDSGAAQEESAFAGPLTGPADVDGSNIFEKSFTKHSTGGAEDIAVEDESKVENDARASCLDSYTGRDLENRDSEIGSQRTDLKRTFTDVSLLSLQTKLMEALAQPYSTRGQNTSQTLLSPTVQLRTAHAAQSAVGPALHSHSSKWALPPQAVFRTESNAPWTILAANDLACLIFGVARAEVRKLSILEVVQDDKRNWLEEKLKGPGVDSNEKARAAAKGPTRKSVLGAKGGITAQLLSKAPSREKKQARAQTDDGAGGYYATQNSRYHPTTKSRGVLLCGDVVPIQKRNGSTGSASFWVMEKRGGLIWILEEIIENVIYLRLDGDGRISEARGDIEPIWGQARIKNGSHLSDLFGHFPQKATNNNGADGGWVVWERRHLTARTAYGINVPTTIDPTCRPGELRVSGFPHIAGVMVVAPSSLKITSSNSVFAAALFGHEHPEGLSITSLIPGFDRLLDVVTEEDDVDLVDGLVIPEHSFRRARAVVGTRDGKENAASIFLRPLGLPARHRDGAEIIVDVQMRVVKSEPFSPSAAAGPVGEDAERSDEEQFAVTEVVYALWVTYSRQLHSSVAGQDQMLDSRPITPPSQPSPRPTIISGSPELRSSSELTESADRAQISLPAPVAEHSVCASISEEPLQHPGPSSVSARQQPDQKKSIDDFVILEEMGAGAYGTVKLVRYEKANSRKMVLKYVTKRRILVDTWTRDRRLGTVPLEIHVMDFLRRDGLRHPNIVEMVDFFEDDINYYVEMIPHGIPGMDLFDYIELRTNMEEAECRSIFKQVVDAIHHLHTKALVVHRDIKDENVVLDGEGRIKLIDFGSAAYIKNGPFDVFVGTIDYAAPEVLQGKAYRGKEQDVWALGILLYTIVYKENPFYNIEEILDLSLRVPFIPFSEACIDLIRRMLDRDVDERITITEVMKHPWIVAE